MKQIKYLITALISLLTLYSCNDWLDVSPKNQVKAKELFKTEAGFRDALFGVYTTMADANAYGGNQSFLTLDIIAQAYTQVGENFTPLYNLLYSTDPNTWTKINFIDPIWEKNYYAIANCNDILAHVDNDKSIFSKGIHEMVKAETKALRAYLHFEILRAYGPVPLAANMDKLAIPVVTRLTNIPVKQSTVKDVIEFVLTELDEARKLIAPFDPIGPSFDSYVDEPYMQNNPVDHYEYADDDGFKLYRRSRLNYYGMTATMARAALWAGRSADALKYAKEVIDSGKFPMATETQGLGSNSTFMYYMTANEFISSVYYNNPAEYIDKVYFNPENSYKTNLSRLYFMDVDIMSLFGANIDFDWRFKKMIALNLSGFYTTQKYSTGTRIPLVKISEMYLICAEASGNLEYLRELHDHRGLLNYPIPGNTDLDKVLTEEYQKEFIGEGQLFYYYKRKNFTQFPNGKQAGEKVYVLPLPDMEIEYGNIITE